MYALAQALTIDESCVPNGFGIAYGLRNMPTPMPMLRSRESGNLIAGRSLVSSVRCRSGTAGRKGVVMADRNKRLDSNVAGNFFVDATCINCDTCRQLAPHSFEEVGEFSAVTHQPDNEGRTHQAYQALLACPTGSIGTERSDKPSVHTAMESFPIHIEDHVYYCGYNSEKSFGANSFFVRHPHGNWLIDSPRYLTRLIDAFERSGGLACIFLTHEDDVADAEKYARHFRAKRIIHARDAEAVPDAEWIVDGAGGIPLADGFLALPVPGHTPGSMALLYNEKFLFAGDHLWWNPQAQVLEAPQQRVWETKVLTASIEKLLAYRFEWVLAGHGGRIKLSGEAMSRQIKDLLARRKGLSSGVRSIREA
jgi:glyoxylase-like metal-dependent hydrolase (beta-lactamase superfamily II)/ferredoxin